MVPVTILLYLILLNATDPLAAQLLFSCVQRVNQGADVVEDTGITMTISQPLMPLELELVPYLQYEVSVFATDPDIMLSGFTLDGTSQDDTPVDGYISSSTVCDTTQTDYRLPLNFTWRTTNHLLPCLTLRIELFFNSTSKQSLSNTLCQPTGCFNYTTDPSGVVTSPDFPLAYPDGLNCSFYIMADQGETIDLQFQVLDVEQPYSSKCFDQVAVFYEGETGGPYCGNWTRQALRSLRFISRDAIKIRFYSDNKLNSLGFKAVYHTVSQKECNASLDQLSGTVTSPGYPFLYLPNVQCVTNIVLPSNYRILIRITDLDIEDGEGCQNDQLRIYDSNQNTSGRSWCGQLNKYHSTELRYESGGSTVTVHFQSDNVVERAGFNLTYLGVPSCNNETFNIENGSVTSVNYPSYYPNGQECFYTINVTDVNDNIELTFKMLNTESTDDIRFRNHLCNKDYVEVFDGRESHRVCGNWTGHEHLLIFRSHETSLVFRFVSDEQTTRPGFYAKWRSLPRGDDVRCVSTLINPGDVCYEVMYHKQNWNDSEVDCRSRGGHLAKISDQETGRLISNHLKNSECTRQGDSFWIGASDHVFESDFYWTDGHKINFSDWFEGWSRFNSANPQPSDDGLSQEDCVELRRTFHYPYKGEGQVDHYKWNDRNCLVKNPYVCQCYRNGEAGKDKLNTWNCDQSIVLTEEDNNVTITSPGYPGNYPDFLNCRIVVIGPRNYSLVVEFQDLNIEDSMSCEYDFLTVSEVPWNLTEEKDITRLCGDWSRKSKLLREKTYTSSVFLHFSTDHSFQFSGFSARVTLAPVADCAEELGSPATGRCLQASPLPVPMKETEVACKNSFEGHVSQTPGFDLVRLLASRLSNDSDNAPVRFWYDIDDDMCQAVVVEMSESYAGRLMPADIKVENVSCQERLYVICFRNETIPSEIENIEVITQPSGTVSEFDSGYADNMKKTWRFEARNGSRFLITLSNIDLEYQDECLYDYLMFKFTKPEGRYCGKSNNSQHFLTRQQKAEVSLVTDYGFNGGGFSISWMLINMEECSNLRSDKEGSISSFNFPLAFPDTLECQTVIQSCLECRVLVEIDFLSLPKEERNSLEIVVGENESIVYNNASDFVLPLKFISDSSNLSLLFKAQDLPMGFGFHGRYRTLHPPYIVPKEVVEVQPEEKTLITSLNSPLPYPPSINHTTVYRAPIGHILSVTFDTVNFEPDVNCSSDAISLSDVSIGGHHKLLTTMCDDSKNRTNMTGSVVISVYNRLELRFVSADVFTDRSRGFSAVVQSIEDPSYMNTTASLKGTTFDSCVEEPCVNGGICKQHSSDTASCSCPGYFTGLFCQVTHCQLSPCDQGECALTNTSYLCVCTPGFWGRHCDHTPSGCRAVFCKGKGTCLGNNTSAPLCKCDSFWEGAECQSPIASSKMTVAIGQRLLGEPIWIGLIVILSVLLAFGIFYIIRRKFGKHFTCCDIKVKKDEKIESKPTQSETPTPVIVPPSFSVMKARRCSIPPPFVAPPIIAITKAEDSCSSTPSYNNRTGDVAARFFASYKEAERTPISAPVAVDFSKTTATSMASDSDDNSIVGGLVGGTLAFAGTRLRNEETRRYDESKMLRATSFLQTPSPLVRNRERMKRSHSTGPYLVRQASLFDDLALNQRVPSNVVLQSEHLFPTVIVDNKNDCSDDGDNSSIQIYLDNDDETLQGAVGPQRQISRSDGSLRHKVLSWRSIAIDDCHSHSELSRRERSKFISRSASVDVLQDQQYDERGKSRSRSEMNSFESNISCECSRCRRKSASDGHRSSSCRSRREGEHIYVKRSYDGEEYQPKFKHVRKRHHRSHRKLHSCSSNGRSHSSSKSVTRASSTESEQYIRKTYASHKRTKANGKRSSKREILNVLDGKNSDKEYGRKEMFAKFFGQEVQCSSENNGGNDEENIFKFPDVSHSSGHLEEENQLSNEDQKPSGATCSVIIYNCTPQNSNRHVSIDRHDVVEKSFSQEDDCFLPKNEQDDSAICSSEATTSSDSFKSNKEKKALVASSSLLTVTTDTDSAVSSAPKSFQASPYHDPWMETKTTYIHDLRMKDSAYQTKQSSVDVIGSQSAIGPERSEVIRKLSMPSAKSEESNVDQRLHQAACKLFLLQQRARRHRFSKDSAVHTISEDEFHQQDVNEEGNTLFNHRRFMQGQIIPLRHLDGTKDHRLDSNHLNVQLKSTATPVSDVDQGSEIGEISV